MNKNMAGILAWVFVAVTAQANVLLSDSFEYPDGPIVGASGSPWIMNTGTAGTALVANRMLDWSGSRTEDIAAFLSAALATNGTVVAAYSSFSVSFTTLPNQAGSYFAHFTGNTLNAHRCRVWSATTNAASGKFRLSIVNSSTGNATNAQYASDLELNTTYKVVTRYEIATGISTLWIDPAAEGDPSVTANDTPGITNILYYAFRQNTGIGNMRIDNLRVGTSFADVAGANNPPSISAIPLQRLPANSSTPAIPFTIGDVETAADYLRLGSASSNPALAPTNNIAFGGSGSDRTVTVTPVAGQQGSAIITIEVTDEDGATTSSSFTLFVGFPSISDIANQNTLMDATAGPISFVVGDAETPAGELTLSSASSNASIVPTNNITFGGTGSNRTVTITPVPGMSGLATITVTVSDGTLNASDTFVLTVSPLLPLQISEPFNYAEGSIADGYNPGGATPWFHHSPDGTNFGEALVLGGELLLSQTNREDINRILMQSPIDPASGVILYASLEVKFTQLPGSSGGYFAHYKDFGNQNFRTRLFANTANAGAGHFRLGIAYNAASINQQFPLNLSTGVTYTAVTRFNVGAGTSTLWVNPSLESDSGVTAADTGGTITVDAFAFRQDTAIGSMRIDNLIVGTAFHDVVRPPLSISATANGVQVSWPRAAYGYVLQSTASLGPPSWGNYSDQGALVGDRRIVDITGLSGNRFFRLIKASTGG